MDLHLSVARIGRVQVAERLLLGGDWVGGQFPRRQACDKSRVSCSLARISFRLLLSYLQLSVWLDAFSDSETSDHASSLRVKVGMTCGRA